MNTLVSFAAVIGVVTQRASPCTGSYIVQSEALLTGTKLDGETTRKGREQGRFERRTSTGSGSFAFLVVVLSSFWGANRLNKSTDTSNTVLVALRQIKKGKPLLLVVKRHSKTSLLKLRGN